MKKGLLSILAAVMSFPLAGCTYILGPLWSTPRLDTDIDYARTVSEDIRLLNELFSKDDVQVWGNDQKSIRWIETDVFRIFQCDSHYVMVYPPNWDKESYSIMLVSGQVDDVEGQTVGDLQKDEYIKAIGNRQGIWMGFEEIEPRRAGLDKSYLGMHVSQFLNTYEQDPLIHSIQHNAMHIEQSGKKYAANQSGSWTRVSAESPYRQLLRCDFTVLNSHLFRLHYQKGNGPTLMRYKLSLHEVETVNSGLVDID